MTEKSVVDIQAFSMPYTAGVTDLILGIQQGEFGLSITSADQPDLTDIPGFYQRGSGNFWVALYQGQVIGTISLLDIGNHQAALRKMFVGKAFRGKTWGTAAALLENLLTWAAKRDVEQIFLGTTQRFLAAHRFYEKNGFELIQTPDLPPSFPIMKVDTRFYRRGV